MNTNIPLVVMTSDVSDWTLGGLLWTIRKRWNPHPRVMVFGYREPDVQKFIPFEFFRIGNFKDYPATKWSNSLLVTMDMLDLEGIDTFAMILDDYWILRDVDPVAVEVLYNYMRQFRYVAKIDLATDRLYANGGGQFLYNNNIYGHVKHIDLIKSTPFTPYHMSLWGGIYNIDAMRDVVIPDERAQIIEIAGSTRLSKMADKYIVLGTKQAPLMHVNVLQGGKPPAYQWGPLSISNEEIECMKADGVEIR